MKRWTIVHASTFNHPFIHWFVQTCKGKDRQTDRQTISTSGWTHGAGLNQQTRSLLCEIRVQKQSSPFSETPNPAQTHTHLSFNQQPPPPPAHDTLVSLETLHLLHFQQLIIEKVGGREVSWRWGRGSGELWPIRTVSTDIAGECVCARVQGSPPICTHNPLHPLCFFGLGNGGCHGQSPESPADLLQVALWLLSSPRSCPDPWPLTPRGLPCALTEDRLELLLRGEATWGLDQTERFVCWNGYFHNSRAPDLTSHNPFLIYIV